MPARPPATPAHAMVAEVEGFFPGAVIWRVRMLYRPKRAVEYVDCRRTEAERPDQRETIPGVGCELTWEMVRGWILTVSKGEFMDGREHGCSGLEDLHSAVGLGHMVGLASWRLLSFWNGNYTYYFVWSIGWAIGMVRKVCPCQDLGLLVIRRVS